MHLKNLGVYALPDGSEFVAEVLYGGECRLCSLKAWNYADIPVFMVNADGRLVTNGKSTNWRIENLIDTGVRERYPKASLAL